MNAEIEASREELTRLCRRFRVNRLELFGSAAAEQFDIGRSDLDFLVDFMPLPPGDHAGAYFGLLAPTSDCWRPCRICFSGQSIW